MSSSYLLASAWDWKPSVVAGCCALVAGYGALTGFRSVARAASWIAGVLLIFVALVSPLDTLADTYLFSAHMAKHMLLVLIIPALLLNGMPAAPFEHLLRRRSIARIERSLRMPAVAWLAGVGAMIAWHIPALFNAALRSEPLHIIEHLSLLIGGTIYWWPILSPLARSRMAPLPHAAAYLFTSCIACTILGVMVTFAPAPLYAAYAHPSGEFADLVRNGWGVSTALDQQIGGLLMWVPGCLIYLTGIMAMFARWYGQEDRIASTHAG